MDSLALYFHWPFCLAKCPYCDFNSHVREILPQAAMLAALKTELAFEAARLGTRRVESIFFGGGTPSLMDPASVAALIEEAGRLFILAPDAEITLEANPTSIEAAKFAAYRAAGVNRMSIGVQSFDPEALRFLGRQHSADQAIAAIELGARTFPRITFDLIYARPGQTQPAWRAELRRALDLAADHLSLYQLTIEDGTKFATLHARGEFVLPDENEAEALYDITAEEAARYGLQRYEISNYAKPGGESRHNLTYWRYGDYVGIGPGAHGRLSLGGQLLATTRHRAPEAWMERVTARGHGTTLEEAIPAEDRAREALIMGLRLREGISAARFAARTGIALKDALEPDILAECQAEGYLTFADDRLAATVQGTKRLDALLPALAR
ncbi:radical SAM family heme chaperone HemW [Acidocella aminolytica]|jgi:oxygen-independent coproporphyrinogen-3 oxidase|uniref:Heme chaperone HemW n=1 Tax=Acidocella aminolytica 101 = DSM 11237 TaxID=1120923 RepID=A0A0D6PI49_9PROT|nr:radical SAM family heme chaperone HemW [Acidocella aminolytica]GAN80504.1 coproporphyrinogen III oxidase HemN [Acidocella aminolytica 101 = DSM 11237]GBQ37844.1 coproporphyrinogen III oxidase [Acidocella aminolytica 101 = DSM 11237]